MKRLTQWIMTNILNVVFMLSFISWIAGICVLIFANSLSTALAGFFLILPSIFHIRTFFSIMSQSGQVLAMEKIASMAAMVNSQSSQSEHRH